MFTLEMGSSKQDYPFADLRYTGTRGRKDTAANCLFMSTFDMGLGKNSAGNSW